jgi:hypothetical protein
VWVWSGAQAGGVREQGADGEIWAYEYEVTGDWRKLRKEELHGVYCSPDIAWVIRSRRLRWAGHVARVGEKNAYSLLVGKHDVGDNMADLGIGGRA